MTPEQWTRVKELFDAALTQDAAMRRAFIAGASGGDDVVRAEVERLLDADLKTSDFMEQPAADALVSGRVIGHYEIERLLGTGGMGRVYAARDVELGRDVALKVASLDGDAQSRLRREAQHASRLSHPNICHIYEVGRADGQLFVVMELVPGRPLADLVGETPLSSADASRYGSEIADALAHAHEHGIIHRDLKSTNVMITPKRGAKVLDFGLARLLDTHQIDALSMSQRSLTAEGMIAGTLPYMAPELLRGQRADQRADIWALGVLLHEMVIGTRPFTGATGFELSAAILRQPLDPLPASVPGPLRAVIERCLAKDPADRYQSAAEVADALQGMKGAAASSGTRIPRISLRWAVGLAALVALSLAAHFSEQPIQPAPAQEFSNQRGYGLLARGVFDEALAEFKGVADQEPGDANAWDSLGEGYLANGMPDEALAAYTRSLTINRSFGASILGRALALAALGQYGEALDQDLPHSQVQAFLLSRVGRYNEADTLLAAAQREAMADDNAEEAAAALLALSSSLIERRQYARAIEQVGAAEKVLQAGDDPNHPLLALASLLGGLAEIRNGSVASAAARLAAQQARDISNQPLAAKWVAALQGELELAKGSYDLAASHFDAAQAPLWLNLGNDPFVMFNTNMPSRDGAARVAAARGNPAAAIEEYKRLTGTGAASGPAAALEPRHILALARLLDQRGDAAAARVEYQRFLTLWANADAGLPEVEEARAHTVRTPL